VGRKAAFIHSERMEQFSYPEGCPFNVSRAGTVRQLLARIGLLEGAGRSEVAPEPAERAVLTKFHSARYLDVLKDAAEGRAASEALLMGIGTGDCPVFKDMYEYSVMACGATLKGAELILEGQADVAFNPSGGLHHAMPERASGFCYLNDVVLGCMVLAEAGKRVLYLDVDVHHGDGVQFAFYGRNDVMTISFHQTGRTLFPGTGFEDEIGTGDGVGYSVNVPFMPGAYDGAYLEAFEQVVLPLADAFKPDVFVFELGADALAGDPLANLRLTNNTYVRVIKGLLGFGKPILMTGGGGYNIDNTVRAWALAWMVLSGGDDSYSSNAGMGGVMLQTTDWPGGLRDRELPVSDQQRRLVDSALDATIDRIKKSVFPIHGI